MIAGGLRAAQEVAPNSVGQTRQQFYVPGTITMGASLQVIVIKKPSEEDLALLRSGIGSLVKSNSKVIFNESIPLNGSYTRELLDNAGTQVIGTQNQGVQRKTVKAMAEQAAVSVRDMILYAF